MTTSAITADLLTTKLAVPQLSSPRLLRRSLLDRLDEGLRQKLTLLSAPAGFGKTTLAAEWAYQRMKDEGSAAGFANGRMKININSSSGLHPSSFRLHPSSFAWVSLDPGDNDPLRFWRYTFTAVQAFEVEAAQTALALLNTSQQPNYEKLLTALINGLAARASRHVLVLDDYHCITDSKIHESVAFLLDHLPPALHLVLSTRSDPPLPLARLRARNEVSELRATDLRFSEAETHEFLQLALQAGSLDADIISADTSARLAERTEGWPAGLRLAALALQDQRPGCCSGGRSQDRCERFLDTFTGSHRAVVEYLVADVLAAQKGPIQEFLLETSHLSRLTGPLCDAVTGRKDGARTLYQLERANLFLEPLDGSGQWYRFHALFAEAMQAAARQRLGRSRLRQLALNASLWYEARGMLSEAIEFALSARDFERAAGLIERRIKPRLAGNEYHSLLRWMQKLPEDVLCAHPALCLAYAAAVLFTQEIGAPVPVDRLHALLAMAENGWSAERDPAGLGALQAFRALVAVRLGDYAAAFTLSRKALELLPENGAPAGGFTNAGSKENGSREHSSLEIGIRGSTSRATHSHESLTEWRGVCLIFAGWGEYYAGRLNAALKMLGEARALLQSAGNVYGLLDASLCLGEIHAGRTELQQAADLYRQALVEAESAPIERKDGLKRQGRALLGLAKAALERSDLEAAWQDASRAAATGEELDSQELITDSAILLARVQWARGEIEAARGCLSRLAARTKKPPLLGEIESWQVRLSLSAGDLAAGQRWLAAQARPTGDLPPRIQEQEALLLARLQIAQGEAESALRQLERWLTNAQAQGRTRSELEIHMLIAQAQAARRCQAQARQSLLQALALAQPDSFLRVFLDEGEPLRLLIEDCRLQIEEHGQERLIGFIDLLLTTYDGKNFMNQEQNAISNHQSSISNPIDLLSDQEERVLRLLAGGLSNQEIGQELVISVNTVKTHVKSIYRKLEVNSRRAARRAARDLEFSY